MTHDVGRGSKLSMVDVSFAAFTAKSFEQFAQALSEHVLGRGILVYGAGPDGGREAATTANLTYPTPANGWRRYTVVQAKFLERSNSPAKDADWLVTQIRKEAQQWRLRRDKPINLLFITNVRLSGIEGRGRKGGQQKVEEVFQEHLQPLGVEQMHVWHEEKIGTLLDGFPDLYRSYLGWLSPRDLLATVFESFSASTPNFDRTMIRFLQRELRDQRAVNLLQAGHATDDQVPLDAVFVDLPVQIEDGAGPPNSENVEVLRTLMGAAALKLDPASLAMGWPNPAAPAPARHLLLGGPGQGKSTITQFMAQVARWRLLRDQAPEMLTPEVKPILDAIEDRLVEIDLPLESIRRYPLRIDLPTYADKLAAAGSAGLSILDFLAAHVARVANDQTITTTVLRRWLQAYPWLVLFDGLDEVPPSANRAQLLGALTDFWDEAISVGADVAAIVTSRQQGYNDDLAPSLHVKLEMARITPAKALDYAGRLALRRIPGEIDRERVLGKLQEAAEGATTALLMVSPLQVAIMLQLINARGSAPTDRWTLFNDYLALVIKREQEKPGEPGRIMQKRQRVIEQLIRRVGLVLHVRAERDGGAEAQFTPLDLNNIAFDLFIEDGLDEDDARHAAHEIIEAATDRLVFLQQRIQGFIEFEVRSLQEFSAAAEIMSGDDVIIRDRLDAIAGRAHWQHVYRIAASKIFSVPDANKYRDTIVAVNTAIDNESDATRATNRGAQMSLDLLADGLASDQPKYRRDLAAHALNIARLGVRVDRRLIGVMLELGAGFARGMLPAFINSSQPLERVSGWDMLMAMVREREDWADCLIENWWPADAHRQAEAASCGILPPRGSIADGLIEAFIANHGPVPIKEGLIQRDPAFSTQVAIIYQNRFPIFRPMFNIGEHSSLSVEVLPEGESALTLKLMTIDDAQRSLAYESGLKSSWRQLEPVAAFLQDPGKERLAAFAESLHSEALRAYFDQSSGPWMLTSVAAMVRSGMDPDAAAALIRSGGFGDWEDWEAAERRLTSDGVQPEDLYSWSTLTFFDSTISSVGVPHCHFLSLSLGQLDTQLQRWIDTLLPLARAARIGAPLDQIRRILRFACSQSDLIDILSAEDFDLLFTPHSEMRGFLYLDPSLVPLVKSQDVREPRFLSLLSDVGGQDRFSLSSQASSHVLAFIDAVREEIPTYPGIITLALAATAHDGKQMAELLRSFAGMIDSLRLNSNTPRSSLAVLELVTGVRTASDVLRDLLGHEPELASHYAVLELAESGQIDDRDAEILLASLLRRDTTAQIRARCITELNKLADRRPSELGSPIVWKCLRFPSHLVTHIH